MEQDDKNLDEGIFSSLATILILLGLFIGLFVLIKYALDWERENGIRYFFH